MPLMTEPATSPRRGAALVLCGALLLALPGCDLLTVSQAGRNIREGNEAVVRGELQRAVQYYESALDGTMLSAEAHYRLGLVYEDQLKNQVAALHHFERYLELAPQGQFATDVKNYVDRLRLVIVSSLSEGTVLPAREASRLRNENLELRQQLTDLRQQEQGGRTAAAVATPTPVATPAPQPTPTPLVTQAMIVAATPPPLPPGETPEPEVRRAIPVAAAAGAAVAEPPAVSSGPRSHTVVRGDTLARMARTYYQNSNDWPKILEANKEILEDPTKLQPGMVLTIP
jgi:tetratricopeptide (TPR) repeat protein